MKSLADKYICTNTNHHECETHQCSWSKCLHIVTQIPQAGLAAVRDAVSPNREQFLARFQTKQHPALFLNLNNRYLSRNVGFYSSHAKNIFFLYPCMLSHVQLFATPRPVAHQAPLSMGFSRQEYWGGLPFHSPGDLPDPGIKPESPVLASRFFTSSATWEALVFVYQGVKSQIII